MEPNLRAHELVTHTSHEKVPLVLGQWQIVDAAAKGLTQFKANLS